MLKSTRSIIRQLASVLVQPYPPSRMMAYPYPRPYPIPSDNLMHTFTRPSFITITRQVYIAEGLAGFYRGLTPIMLRAFPVNASALFVYEGVMRLLDAEEVGLLSLSCSLPFKLLIYRNSRHATNTDQKLPFRDAMPAHLELCKV